LARPKGSGFYKNLALASPAKGWRITGRNKKGGFLKIHLFY
jgi:hypothetical protein